MNNLFIENILSPLLETSIKKALKPEFMTSLDVVNKVMNVPECALKALLRENGYDEIETKSICIDEKMLLVFADAYIRKLRSYFINSNRNLHLLTPQESSDLEEFYTTFKKKDVEHTNVKNWNQIDTELIRDYFVQQVKEQTPHHNCFYDEVLYRIFSCKRIENISCKEFYSSIECTQPQNSYCKNNESKFLVRITKSRYYQSRLRTNNAINQNNTTIIRQLYTTARYYTFPVDNNESDEYNKRSFLMRFVHVY
ncbi:MAG: hypothetical protein E7085_03710 [Parabacteroides distasonis]|nr:hypothetical protein [Parabacteroides distasonis]